MKIKQLKEMIGEVVSKAIKESSYGKYMEGSEDPTDPSWFDTLMAPDEPVPQLKGSSEARKLVDFAKNKLMKLGPKIDKDAMNLVAASLEDAFELPDGVAWEVVHAAYEETKSDSLSGSSSVSSFGKKGAMTAEAFAEMVRKMIQEEVLALKEEKDGYKGPKKKCPKCGGEMRYDDGKDAFVCGSCKHSPGNGPAGV
jgi:ribosomal protein S27AE